MRMRDALPRFYFDVHDAHGYHRDDFGEPLASFEEARDQCQSLLPDIAREELPDGEMHTVTCEVRDESGAVIYRGELTYRGTRIGGTG